MTHVVVIGAGIVGASAAYWLAQRDVDVTILDAQSPAAGTTSNSFAWANANEKEPREYFALNVAGMEEHHRLARELGDDWFQRCGNLEIARTQERRDNLRKKVARLQSWGYAADLVSSDDARAMVPDLNPAVVEEAQSAFYAREGWVAAPVLVARLLGQARRRGARVLWPRRAAALMFQGDRVIGVETDAERIHADHVVDCSGPAAGRLLEPLGWTIERARSRGLLVITNDVASNVDRLLHLDDVHLRPDGAGRVRMGAVEIDELLPVDEPITIDSPLAAEVLRRATRAIPILSTARIETIRLGWRALPADGLSVIGAISGLYGYYVIFTHSGVTLGPLLGRLATDEIVSGIHHEELAMFRPRRLLRSTG